jgi:hypothetical protein
VPIIAVSASLIERDRQQYIDAGFDAWILKPIPFDRLNKLMGAIVDTKSREECVYQPGQWERGGWFHMGQKSSEEADTKPSGEAPMTGPSEEAQEAASSEDPTAGQDGSADTRDEEHERLLENQAEDKIEPPAEEPPAEEPPAEDTTPVPSTEENPEPPEDEGTEQQPPA